MLTPIDVGGAGARFVALLVPGKKQLEVRRFGDQRPRQGADCLEGRSRRPPLELVQVLKRKPGSLRKLSLGDAFELAQEAYALTEGLYIPIRTHERQPP